MATRTRIDGIGAAALAGFSLLLAFNQVVIKLVNEGLQPIFLAGVRSLLAAGVLVAVMALRGAPARFRREMWGPGIAIGLVFAFEFVCLFLALDLTTVTRTSVIFYSMPVWMALAAHFLLPGERLTRTRAAGLALAFAGVVVAILWRGGGGEASLVGDLLALGAAFGWAGIALIARGTRLREVRPDMQLVWQLAVSAPVLLAASPFFGPFLREWEPVLWWGVGFQVALASGGFLFWLWLLTVYPASGVAAFAFLAPCFGVLLGWGMLGEPIGWPIAGALALVAGGLLLMNLPVPPPQVPQKVASTTSSGRGGAS
ncbi:drug/metabolite transporter (DMT)-like permease [Hasllibacter halocynthiae]|uniref:Drug/metabolite transporter (DMT)-like permease n=1 Tax=Hasllibacter halocynthiae TaxID=595589 RepID=A0A2T0X7L1_9RHOB|nr:DMT family transporter [Hasllibacter halocynthiae]PRY94916.1 drug/metabolite transporter (DMT)-like permease [Hasllibacter halocynthiae]